MRNEITQPAHPLLMRYTQPAGHFNEALPVGNGRLRAMVFVQPHRERLILNEDSCWAGRATGSDESATLLQTANVVNLDKRNGQHVSE